MITEILIAFIILTIARAFLKYKNKCKSYPPGPWGLPILGHLPLLGGNPPMKLMEWSKTYGPILFLRLGNFPTVVLNDSKLIKEAFVKEEFSGRPLLKLFEEAGDRKGLLCGDGPNTSQQRRFVLSNLKDFGFGSSSMEVRIQEEISKFLKKLQFQTGKHTHMNNFFQFPVINSFWDLIMGHRFDEKDPTITEFTALIERITDVGNVGTQLGLFVTWLPNWMGFLGYNKSLAAWREVYTYMVKQINDYKITHESGSQKDFTGVYLDKIADTTDPKSTFYHAGNHQPMTTGDLFMAALDTTTKSLDWLLIHMVRNPKIQKKLQAEIDEVVGDSRVPSLSDRNKMPYSEAVVYELLRITPTLPLALGHRTLQDVEFHGYTLPRNTMILANIYGVQHNENIWEQPDEFIPERFLDHNGKLKKHSDFLPFSFGKRSCVGEAHAKDNLFLIGTSFFQKFSVSCTENVPTLDNKLEMVLAPHPFELSINARSVVQ